MNNSNLAILNDIISERTDILHSLAEQINSAKRIAVVGHVNPDGDCIGCQLGLRGGLTGLGKSVSIINDGPFDNSYTRDYADKFSQSSEIRSKDDFDLFIVADSSSAERVAVTEDKIDFNRTIIIDHHQSGTNFGKTAWIEDSFVSASEMVFILLSYMGVTFTPQLAQVLLDGVLSDNGYYQHIRTHKYGSLYITYLLIGYGGDPNLSYRRMFCNNTLDTEKLFSKILGRTESLCSGKILWSYIYKSDRNIGGQTIDFNSGMMFRDMLSVKGMKVAVFFKIDEEENEVNISFRSTDDIDVAAVAGELGGGGHKVASGCTVKGDFDTVKNKVLNMVTKIV